MVPCIRNQKNCWFSMDKTIHVLIVEDDKDICSLLCRYLADFGIAAQSVNNGTAMQAALAAARFDLLLLDLMLPGENGLSLCRKLRVTSNLGIIMITARGEPADRVVGLELGADDYVVKPFDLRELVARIHTVLRRVRHPNQHWPAALDSSRYVYFEGWELDRISHQLKTPQRMIIPLSNMEFRLLSTFVAQPGRVLSRDQLMDSYRGPLCIALDRSIDLQVSHLRKKLGDNPKAPVFLKTIRGEGYLFDARVTR